jgi:hypothetical protein
MAIKVDEIRELAKYQKILIDGTLCGIKKIKKEEYQKYRWWIKIWYAIPFWRQNRLNNQISAINAILDYPDEGDIISLLPKIEKWNSYLSWLLSPLLKWEIKKMMKAIKDFFHPFGKAKEEKPPNSVVVTDSMFYSLCTGIRQRKKSENAITTVVNEEKKEDSNDQNKPDLFITIGLFRFKIASEIKKDFYFLGINGGECRLEQISKAYKEKALILHPDKSKKPKAEADEDFKALSSAYQNIKAWISKNISAQKDGQDKARCNQEFEEFVKILGMEIEERNKILMEYKELNKKTDVVIKEMKEAVEIRESAIQTIREISKEYSQLIESAENSRAEIQEIIEDSKKTIEEGSIQYKKCEELLAELEEEDLSKKKDIVEDKPQDTSVIEEPEEQSSVARQSI